jgi:acyl-CoA reductase-like NAD-dependent aldehyde dehydrogenase
VRPTVFADVTDDMKIAQEEIFGPVMAVLKFRGLDELVDRANKTGASLSVHCAIQLLCGPNGSDIWFPTSTCAGSQ